MLADIFAAIFSISYLVFCGLVELRLVRCSHSLARSRIDLLFGVRMTSGSIETFFCLWLNIIETLLASSKLGRVLTSKSGFIDGNLSKPGSTSAIVSAADFYLVACKLNLIHVSDFLTTPESLT